MQLSRKTLADIHGSAIPDERIFQLPEKILQFGTGILLRGLIDYFIDQANRKGIFNGRVVMVKSTTLGTIESYLQQDCLYTLCIRGMENGTELKEDLINASISRVLNAADQWQQVLAVARNPELEIIISNTTEVGITLEHDDIRLSPPHSFPGKLLAVLYHRYQSFQGSQDAGLVIIPTELLPANADRLRSIVLELAGINQLETPFIEWIKTANHFCNSLVDRIVPGALKGEEKLLAENRLGYTDELIIMAENFRLWAIETGDPRVIRKLSFSEADKGVIIAPDIEKFRELKLRLLNGTHTFTCGLAFLAGFETVQDGMKNTEMVSYVEHLALQEIAVAIEENLISYNDAVDYTREVLDRFRNPFLEHRWLNITLQYSSKMKMRNIPILKKHYEKSQTPPEHIAVGFAAYLLFMKSKPNDKGVFMGHANLDDYPVQDDMAGWLSKEWEKEDPEIIVKSVLANSGFWGMNLAALPGFADKVTTHLRSLMHNGAMATIRTLHLAKTLN